MTEEQKLRWSGLIALAARHSQTAHWQTIDTRRLGNDLSIMVSESAFHERRVIISQWKSVRVGNHHENMEKILWSTRLKPFGPRWTISECDRLDWIVGETIAQRLADYDIPAEWENGTFIGRAMEVIEKMLNINLSPEARKLPDNMSLFAELGEVA